jgi:hypothetical protein
MLGGLVAIGFQDVMMLLKTTCEGRRVSRCSSLCDRGNCDIAGLV